jgi:hypothetical protein
MSCASSAFDAGGGAGLSIAAKRLLHAARIIAGKAKRTDTEFATFTDI